MKLNWFSPLLPAKTGIAAYTAHLLPALADVAEVALWTEQAEWDRGLEAHARVRSYGTAEVRWQEVNQADLSIYHLGNNAIYHRSIWELSRRHPGLVVLHDLRLQDFFGAVYKHGGNRTEYLEAMTRYYGRAGREAAEKYLQNAVDPDFMSQHFPLTALGIENALGALVHNREGLTDLQRHKRWSVGYAPLPFPVTSRPSKTRVETLHRSWARGPCHLIVFGFIGPNRRLDAVIEALAGHPQREKFRLDVYGELWDVTQVQKQIRDRRLQDLVHLHGFVPEARLDQALASADLALNLRFPTMGETSYCQLRIWNHALPSLVSPVGWYAAIPESVVGFVRPDHEVEDLRNHLNAFLADPAVYVAKGQMGRALLEEQHTPQAYAEAIVTFARDLLRCRTRAIAYTLAERVSTELSGWSGPQLGDQGSQKAAQEIMGLVA